MERFLFKNPFARFPPSKMLLDENKRKVQKAVAHACNTCHALNESFVVFMICATQSANDIIVNTIVKYINNVKPDFSLTPVRLSAIDKMFFLPSLILAYGRNKPVNISNVATIEWIKNFRFNPITVLFIS